ncbi:MAG TPA: hypothetical protein VFV01_34760 [Spirillospora sp.]|nr:hypothetical protein [Spirillospora sp.]
MTEIEDVLRDVLRARAEAFPAAPDAWALVRERAAARRRRRRLLVPAAAGAATVAAAAAALVPGMVMDGRAPRTGPAATAAPSYPPIGSPEQAGRLAQICHGGFDSRNAAPVLEKVGALRIPGWDRWLIPTATGGQVKLDIIRLDAGRTRCMTVEAAGRTGARRIPNFVLGQAPSLFEARAEEPVSWIGYSTDAVGGFQLLRPGGGWKRVTCTTGGEVVCVRLPSASGTALVFATRPTAYPSPGPGLRIGRGLRILGPTGRVLKGRPYGS